MAKGFTQQLRIAVDASKDDLDDVLSSSVIALMSVAIIKTPIDKGRARNNWFVQLGDKNVGNFERKEDRSGKGSLDDLRFTANNLTAGGSILLYNNLPYIERLENGYSEQAAAGMVRSAVASWSQIVESNK